LHDAGPGSGEAVVGSGLAAEDFFRPGNAATFAAMERIHSRGDVVDPGTLAVELKALGTLDTAGGMAFIASVCDAVPSASNYESYARTVQEMAALRRIASAARKVLNDVSASRGVSAEDVHTEAVRTISSVKAPMFGASMQPIKEIILSVYEELEQMGSPDLPVEFSTGLTDVDRMIGGAKAGDLIILAARPSMGKSSFALSNIGAEMAITHRKHVAVFSPETKRGPMTKRLLQSESRVNFNAARERGGIDDLDFPRLAHATDLLSHAPISFDDTSGLTLAQMRSKLRRLCTTSPHGPPKIIIVDYLQKMRHPMSRDNKTGETAAIVEGLKDIAMEFGCILVALSQLSREVEKRPDKRPMMSDLRYAGEIEQEADIIIFLYRQEQYDGPTDKQGNSLVGKAEAIIAKSRDGRTGNILLAFEADFTRFANSINRLTQRRQSNI
jgi:replicative DNA helicase